MDVGNIPIGERRSTTNATAINISNYEMSVTVPVKAQFVVKKERKPIPYPLS